MLNSTMPPGRSGITLIKKLWLFNVRVNTSLFQNSTLSDGEITQTAPVLKQHFVPETKHIAKIKKG